MDVEGDTLEGAGDLVDGGIADSASTVQFIYGESLLDAVPIGSALSAMRFRRDGGFGQMPIADRTYDRFDVILSPSRFAPGSLSTTFGSNVATGAVLGRSGPLTISTYSYPGGAAPNPFSPVISLTNPYTYLGGDLLITIRHTGFHEGRFLDAHADPATQYLLAGGSDAITAVTNLAMAPVVRFDVTAVKMIPEPAVFVLISLAGAALCWRRGRR